MKILDLKLSMNKIALLSFYSFWYIVFFGYSGNLPLHLQKVLKRIAYHDQVGVIPEI